MVLDDVQGRGAFPPGAEAFVADSRFQDLAPPLAVADDYAREAQGRARTGRVRFRYGLFQYDLQNILEDPDFWRRRVGGQTGLWGDPEACCDPFLRKYRLATERYNGRGPNAREYRNIIRRFEALAAAAI